MDFAVEQLSKRAAMSTDWALRTFFISPVFPNEELFESALRYL
jgi:hypothetical protein